MEWEEAEWIQSIRSNQLEDTSVGLCLPQSLVRKTGIHALKAEGGEPKLTTPQGLLNLCKPNLDCKLNS